MPLLSQNRIIGNHKIEGIGDDFVPDDPSAFVNSSIQLLFHFTNTPAKDGKPANDEAAVHNTFAGGSNTSSSSETGIVEEEDW